MIKNYSLGLMISKIILQQKFINKPSTSNVRYHVFLNRNSLNLENDQLFNKWMYFISQSWTYLFLPILYWRCLFQLISITLTCHLISSSSIIFQIINYRNFLAFSFAYWTVKVFIKECKETLDYNWWLYRKHTHEIIIVV